jgi:hypothetical protein
MIDAYDPRYRDLVIRQHLHDGQRTLEVMTPWWANILVHDEFLAHYDPEAVTFTGELLHFGVSNGWGEYRLIERDESRHISSWRNVGYWGGAIEGEDPWNKPSCEQCWHR